MENIEKDKQLSALADMLKNGTMTSLDIAERFDVDKRHARRMLSEIARKYPLISVSDKKGYRIATDEDDLNDARHAFAENRKRAKEILKRNKTLNEFITVFDRDFTGEMHVTEKRLKQG